jgi:carbon storage regulator
MLVLARRKGQKILIADNITLEVVECKGGWVSLAFDAPRDVKIVRAELVDGACDCGADRTGPSAEAHDPTCPAK